jgi:GDP-L-fucose synthase
VDHYIADISNLVAENVGYTGAVEWDQSKPEGTPRKLLELRLLGSTGRSPSIDSASSIASTVEWYRANGAAQRG